MGKPLSHETSQSGLGYCFDPDLIGYWYSGKRMCSYEISRCRSGVKWNCYSASWQLNKKQTRTVFLGRVAQRALWRYLKDRQWFEDDRVFVSQEGKPMSRSTIRHILVNAGKRAGAKNVSVHRFRHTCAIQNIRNGGDPFTLQKIFGHSTLDMVKKYLDTVTGDAKVAHQSASPADRWHTPTLLRRSLYKTAWSNLSPNTYRWI